MKKYFYILVGCVPAILLALFVTGILYPAVQTHSDKQELVDVSGVVHSVHVLPNFLILGLEPTERIDTEIVLVVLTKPLKQDENGSIQSFAAKELSVRGMWAVAARPTVPRDSNNVYEALRYCLFMNGRVAYSARPKEIKYLVALRILP
jgi:hypothetical protein